MTGRSLRLTLMSVVALGALTACSPSASDGGTTDNGAPKTNTDLATAMASGAITSTDMVSVTAVIPDITAAPPTIATLEPLSGKLQEVEPGGPMVAVELLEAFTPMPARPEGTGPVDKDKQPPLEDFFVRSADVEAGIRAGMEIVWLDARDKLNYDFSHIPGAINAPFFEVAEHVSEIPRDKWVVSYCECPHHESGEAAMGLWSEGYRYVKVLEEGFAGWRDGLGMPVEASPKTP